MADSGRPHVGNAGSNDRVVRAEYDWSTTSPSTAVIETVAAATNRETADIGPLYDRVDPDALDSFISPEGSVKDNDDRLVSFEFGGKHVMVRATGEVTVQPTD